MKVFTKYCSNATTKFGPDKKYIPGKISLYGYDQGLNRGSDPPKGEGETKIEKLHIFIAKSAKN